MKFIILFNLIIKICICSFIPNANHVIFKEQVSYHNLLEIYQLPCHSQSARIKSFKSSIYKMNQLQITNLYDIHDLIAFRYVFYDSDDLFKFYHHMKLEKTILYTKNYISKPKDNGYSALHIRYINDYDICPIKLIECQLYLIDDYYNAIYGKAKYNKNYTDVY